VPQPETAMASMDIPTAEEINIFMTDPPVFAELQAPDQRRAVRRYPCV
jgi:hypothetical protein